MPCRGCNIEYLDWLEEGCQLSWCWQCSKPYCTWCLERPRTHPCRGKAVQNVRAALQKPPPETPTTPVEDDVENDDGRLLVHLGPTSAFYTGPSWADVDDDDQNEVNDDRDKEGERIREDLDLGERIQAILTPREGAPQDPEQAVAAAHLRLQQAPDQVHYLRLRAGVAAGESKDKRQKT